MSSYYPSFSYLNKNSQKDFGWIVASLDPDSGEVDSGMSQEQIYNDSYRGTKRLVYGTRYDTTPIIKITVLKCNGVDFSVAECRSAYRWLIGNPCASWLNLYADNTLQFSFLVTIKDVKPYKLDARTVALNIYCESVSPWAYSPLQHVRFYVSQVLSDNNGVLYNSIDSTRLKIEDDGTLYNEPNTLNMLDDGTVLVDNTKKLYIDNQTDDLYTPIYLNTTYKNNSSDYLSIKNITTGEESIITDLGVNEMVTLSAEQFIISDIPGKIFGNTFNFVWPKLVPGINEFIISGSGNGNIEFSYRYPIKIGDCAIDLGLYLDGGGCECNTPDGGPDSGNNCDCTVDKQALYTMLSEVLI